MTAELELEWRTYLSRKPDLLRRGEGRYVLVSGGKVIGLFDTESEGLKAGYGIVGLDRPFLLHLVAAEEPTAFLGAFPCLG